MTSESPQRPAEGARDTAPDQDPDEGLLGAVEGQAGVAGDIARAAAERLAFFSDAVVAIAITLLAIELPVPEGDNDTDFLHNLSAESFTYLTFLISFIAIANHWAAHHRVFRYLARADGALVTLNLAWLLLIVLTPFLTEVLREGEHLSFIRFGMYALAQALLLFLFAIMVARMSRHELFIDGTPATLSRRGWVSGTATGLGFLVSIPLYPLFGAWAFAVWIIVPVVLMRAAVAFGFVPSTRRS